MRARLCWSALLIALVPAVGLAEAPGRRPNVILILTDDQGYGDLASHGNEKIATPAMDALRAESVRLLDFHVDPTCSPTRSALLTGRYSTRTGVWHTILGRSVLRPEETTLAELFAAAGYRTAMFGKWHLGDNYPCRPQDQGFETALYHKGGGIGHAPDYWGNDYFDDTLFRDGVPEKHEGYVTDVWFREARRYIEAHREEPFFLYLATNAPHWPYRVPASYSKPYTDASVPPPMDAFYGMITSIDENLGRLRERLQELGIADDTILIFTTDNGTAAGVAQGAARGGANPLDGWRGFNAGMRGTKGSAFDGGHRVPFFIRWPRGGVGGGCDIPGLTAHIDVLPTLLELCGISEKPRLPVDGISLADCLKGKVDRPPARTLLVHSQRIPHPEKWKDCAVMTDRWRLIGGRSLFDIEADPGEMRDVAAAHPDVVKDLRVAYEAWWKSLEPSFEGAVEVVLGSDHESPTQLSSHDWLCEDTDTCPWHQGHIEEGAPGQGPWAVRVESAGLYEVSLCRWPPYLERSIDRVWARVKIGSIDEAREIDPALSRATFELHLEPGSFRLESWLRKPDGSEHGAYFVEVTRKT